MAPQLPHTFKPGDRLNVVTPTGRTYRYEVTDDGGLRHRSSALGFQFECKCDACQKTEKE